MSGRPHLIDDLLRDVRHGARLLRRQPHFAAVVLTTLAIAIGATVTVFTVADAWLLKPLNFPAADRLVIAFAARPERPTEPAVWLPYRGYLALKERSRTLKSVSAAFVRDVAVTTARDAQTVLGLAVTPELFRTLGVHPLHGRTISEAEAGGPPVVVLSYGFWQRHFGGSTNVIGTPVTMSGVPYEIIGVMPREFEVRVLDMRFDFWTPLRNDDTQYGPAGLGPVAVLARLRDDTTIATAQAEVRAIVREAETHYQPNFNRFVVTLASLQADNTRTVRATLLTVGAAVMCLLLITAMNVGTLLLGRGLGRMREAAIRAAMGGDRSRLVRQFLTESLLLSCLGGIGGLLLATIAVQLFSTWNPLGALPANAMHVDARAMAVACAAMAATTIVAGLVPALRASNADPQDALRAGGARATSAAPVQRAQTAMLLAQMAVCLMLLVAAALMIRTFARLQQEPLGFDANDLWVADVILPTEAFRSADARVAFSDRLAERIRALPGVRSVAAGTSRPLTSGAPMTVHTKSENDPDARRFSEQAVSHEYFSALAIPVVAGRAFDARDTAAAAPVVIVNDRAARELFGGTAEAVGRRVRLNDGPWREVVGVVGNVRSSFFNTLEWNMDPIVYRPAPQAFDELSNPMATIFGFSLHIRSDRSLTIADVRNAVRSADGRAAVTELRTAHDIARAATRQPAFRMTLLFGFAAVGLLLAAIGTYGLVSQAVAQGLRDIAIRLALGADRATIVRGIVRRAAIAAVAGVILGTAGALLVGRALATLVYGVAPDDVISLLTASATLLATAAIGAAIPALRAARVDPATILRAE